MRRKEGYSGNLVAVLSPVLAASLFAGCAEGFDYLKANRAIFMIIITMALLNFFSRLTYENILSPMILAGSGMAVMFLCTGILGALFSLISYQQKDIRKLDKAV